MYKSKGFTLIELLVVLTIVSLLTAAALPAYRAYRRQAYDFRALNDLRMVALAEESYFIEAERYLSCQNSGCASLPSISKLSEGVNLSVTGAEESFTAQASHPKGTGKIYRWDSEGGGLVE